MKWTELNFWQTGEYQVIKERWNDLKKSGQMINPVRKEVFRALKETPYEDTRVIVCGQDPYPSPGYSTGVAFSIPADVPVNKYPPTLVNLLTEYHDDLHYPAPGNGDLGEWCRRGVLLWNVIPSCTAFSSLSHDWVEWEELNKEMIHVLNAKQDIVFVFLGTVARRYQHLVDGHSSLYFSHPSPRANRLSAHPFLGSRMFSTINQHLKEPIDWRLP